MVIKTQVKDWALIIALFSPLLFLWGWAYANLGLRIEFLSAPIGLLILIGLRRCDSAEKQILISIAGILALLLIQIDYFSYILKSIPKSHLANLTLALLTLAGMSIGTLTGMSIGLISFSSNEQGDKTSYIFAFYSSRFIGGILTGIFAGIAWTNSGTGAFDLLINAGKIVLCIIGGLIAGGEIIIASLITSSTGTSIIMVAIIIMIIESIINLIVMEDKDFLREPIKGLIVIVVASIIMGAIAGAIGDTIRSMSIEWLMKMSLSTILYISLTSLIIIFIFISSLFFLNRKTRLSSIKFTYPALSVIFSSLFFPVCINFIFKGIDNSPLFHLYSGISVHITYLFFLILPAALITSIYNPFLQSSIRERNRWNYVSLYPDLFCPIHLCKTRKERLTLFYNDVKCKVEGCSNNNFFNVSRIVGLIGGDIDLPSINNNTAYVPLWKKREQRAVNADIDELEIRGSGDMNQDDYDKAVDMVYNALSRNPDLRLKKIPVRLTGNPPLSERAIILLKDNFNLM